MEDNLYQTPQAIKQKSQHQVLLKFLWSSYNIALGYLSEIDEIPVAEDTHTWPEIFTPAS